MDRDNNALKEKKNNGVVGSSTTTYISYNGTREHGFIVVVISGGAHKPQGIMRN